MSLTLSQPKDTARAPAICRSGPKTVRVTMFTRVEFYHSMVGAGHGIERADASLGRYGIGGGEGGRIAGSQAKIVLQFANQCAPNHWIAIMEPDRHTVDDLVTLLRTVAVSTKESPGSA